MKTYFILLIILVFISCNSDSEKNTSDYSNIEYQVELFPDRKIYLDNRGRYFYSFQTQVFNDSVLIRKISKMSHIGLDFVNLNNGRRSSMLFNEDILREINLFRSFFYLSKDSIILTGRNKILIVNDSGRIKYSHFLHPPESAGAYLMSSMNDSPIFFRSGILYASRLIDLPPAEIYPKNNLIGFDTKKDSFFELPGTTTPEIYYGKCYIFPHINTSHTFNEEKAILNFPIDDYVYVYDLDKQRMVAKHKARSRHKTEEVKPVDCNKMWQSHTYRKQEYTSTTYISIAYDPYRKVYYRFVKHPKKEYDLKKQFNSLNLPFSIMVLNEDLQVIGETEILNEPPRYIHFDYFINSEGLWISVNNPDNPEYDEDRLVFQLFKLEER